MSWTTISDFHMRTHIIYSYVTAGRPFPNLDGIINATISAQLTDGSWRSDARPVYYTSIQISLLNQILKLYPNYRTGEIILSLEKAKIWTNSVYHTEIINEKVCGFFGDTMSLDDSLFAGVLCAGQTGLINANIDMTLEDLRSKIIPISTPTPQVTLSIDAGIGGTTSPIPGNYIYDLGSQVTISASPRNGYIFEYWLMNDASKNYSASVVLSMSSSRSALALFSVIPVPTPTPSPGETPGPTVQPTPVPTPIPVVTPTPTSSPVNELVYLLIAIVAIVVIASIYIITSKNKKRKSQKT